MRNRQAELAELRKRLDTVLSDTLCEIKPGYDDSICGFNEAWDVMRRFFDAESKRIAND